MAVMWQGSLIPWIKANGDPEMGALVEFFDANTSTPQTVYLDANLSTPAGEDDRTANARGMFDALFLNATPGTYRVRVTDEDGAVIWDIPEADVPQSADYVAPESGDTSEELLFRTGMMIDFYGATPPSGWVRANGRSIGSGASAGSERANDDTEQLFLHLWSEDPNLAVSGGRGVSSASDWAANKALSLPDLRERTTAGLATMGNVDAGRVDDSFVDGGSNSSTLGATAGTDDAVLVKANLPNATLTGTTSSSGLHGHPTYVSTSDGNTNQTSGGIMLRNSSVSVYVAHDSTTPDGDAGDQIGQGGLHTHTITTEAMGSGTGHNNMQPTLFVGKLLKL